jgi:three-Cys-motif partner protein
LNEDYLLPIEDGLPYRLSNSYAKYKLRMVETYLKITTNAMKDKWKNICYLDLQAGPGKNYFKQTHEVILGSPLIALTLPNPPTHFFFNELTPKLNDALTERVQSTRRPNILRWVKA